MITVVLVLVIALICLTIYLNYQVHIMATNLQDEITALTAAVANETTVEQSAIALINGIPALILAAAQQASAAGATVAQLASLDALMSTIQANADSLQKAVTANTTPPPTPAPAPAPAVAEEPPPA